MPDVKLERRSILGAELETREDGPQLIRGYAAAYNSSTDLGWFTEEIAPGAFDRSLREKSDILALYDHDWGRLLGRTSNQTLSLRSDSRGLAVENEPPDTPTGLEVKGLMKRGDLRGMSFGFLTRDDKWEKRDGKDHRTLIDVDLYEVSVVAWPAYDDTEAALRSRKMQKLSRRSRQHEIDIARARLALTIGR